MRGVGEVGTDHDAASCTARLALACANMNQPLMPHWCPPRRIGCCIQAQLCACPPGWPRLQSPVKAAESCQGCRVLLVSIADGRSRASQGERIMTAQGGAFSSHKALSRPARSSSATPHLAHGCRIEIREEHRCAQASRDMVGQQKQGGTGSPGGLPLRPGLKLQQLGLSLIG